MDPETSKHLTSTATGRDVLIPALKMVLSPCAARVFIARMKLCRTGSKRGVESGEPTNFLPISQKFRYLKWRYEKTLFSASLGVGFPLHKPN